MARTKLLNGEVVALTAAEETARDAEEAQAAVEKTAHEADHTWKRQVEYPSIGDQLDKIYHDGIDEWKKVIKVTKDKYPKA